MIKVTVGNNAGSTVVFASEEKTLRDVLTENNIDYTKGTTSIDGAGLKPGDVNKTFAELGYDGSAGHDTCFLMNVAKLDNARI